MRSSRVRRGGGGGGEAAAFLAALLCVLLLLSGAADAQGIQRPSVYKTLRGDAPLVIAKGGFSGVFPDSSQAAFAFALSASAPDTSLWCDVQLTKDGIGVCLRDINIGNCTNVPQDAAKNKKYVIDGVPKTGYFTIDFTLSELQTNLALIQGIFSRSERFDTLYQVLSVTDLQSIVKPPSVWLNVQRNIFYRQHGLNMRRYIVSILKSVSVKYISSPELGFLKSISKRVGGRTKLVFRIPDNFMSDPSTNQTYSSLSKNLTFIKTIASGIMVPNTYIWPVTNDNYLLPPTSFVRDAHSAGLEIYASDFANDRVIPYNYSYDPLQEYLSFISDGGFSVDGVLTDYPITASEAIGCFADLNESSKADHGKPLIISHNGASGDYPDCTDLAYQNAIKGGADVIDCALQVTKDGVLICMSSVNLLDTTNVQMTPFSTRTSVIPEIKSTPGIFTFNLTWNDISDSSLKPKISSPLSSYYLVRNPRYTNDGKFVKFSDFLEYGKDKDLSGIMIIVENAAFMAKSLGVDVLESLTTALNDAGYDNQTTKEVMIQSKDSAVLVKLKQQKAKYKLVYTLPPGIGDASLSSLADVKEFAEAVVVDRTSFFATSVQFIINQTSIVKDLQSAGLTVYAQVFRNEFLSQPWDFFSDETVEINSYAQSLKVDGLITDFPKTVRRYKSRNSCTGKDKPAYMETVDVGGLAQLLERNAVPRAQPPTVAPMPGLNATVVRQPPLPPVAPKNAPPGAAPPPGSSPSDAHTTAVSTCILLAAACAALLL